MSFWTVCWSCLLRPLGNGFCSRDIKGGLWGRTDASDIQGSTMSTGPNGVSFHNTSFGDVQYWQYHKRKKKNTDCPLRRRASRRIGESVPCRWGGTCYHGYLFVELLPVLVLLGVWIAAWHTEMKAFTVLHHTDGKTEANTGKA